MTAAASERPCRIALLGNPNTGKTTLFNRLTGLRQRVGNYSGVTVERKVGQFRHGGREFFLHDLPGAYSLAATSPDERVAIDYLCGRLKGEEGRPDAVLCVLDATNLKRHLFLCLQACDLGLPVVVAVNMVDAARKEGLELDLPLLEKRLGVPVVPIVAREGEGLDRLREALHGAVRDQSRPTPGSWPGVVVEGTARLRLLLPQNARGQATDAELRRILFDADSAVAERLGWHKEARRAALEQARHLLRGGGYNPGSAEAVILYQRIALLLEGVANRKAALSEGLTERIDRFLTHPVFGLAAFFTLMAAVFISIYKVAEWPKGLIEAGQGWVQGLAANALEGSPMLSSLVSEGIIAGVGGVLSFLPQILILFFFLSLLEDTGYMARAACLMDRLLRWSGLNGKSFVPMLSSFACAIPGVMAARTIDDPKARLTTILISPFMSCSARLPVYLLCIGAFIAPVFGPTVAGLSLFAMYLLGLGIALPTAWALNKFVFKTKPGALVIELPPYRRPRARDVFWRMWLAGKGFTVNAGTVIFALTFVIWALSYFPRPDSVAQNIRTAFRAETSLAETSLAGREALAAAWAAASRGLEGEEAVKAALASFAEGRKTTPAAVELAAAQVAELEHRTASAYLEQSWMGRAGHAVQPVFEPAGFDWKITVGVLASFPAREVIVATLGTLYSLGGDVDEENTPLRERMAAERWPEGTARAGQPVFTVPVAFGIMVFFALCQQCAATVSVIAREAGWRWAAASFFYMTVLAWIGAVLCQQIGSRLG